MTITITPATTSPAQTTSCPAWCGTHGHEDRLPHFGGCQDITLSLAEPLTIPDGILSDWLSASLWQFDGQNSVISLQHHEIELADLTITEAEALANVLTDLVRRAKAA